MFAFSAILLLACFLGLVSCRTGVDLSVQTNSSTWDCFVGKFNVSYAIIRLYRNIGQIDSNGANTILTAAKAGVSDLGAYMFPCIQTSTYSLTHNITCPSAQVYIYICIDNYYRIIKKL